MEGNWESPPSVVNISHEFNISSSISFMISNASASQKQVINALLNAESRLAESNNLAALNS
jgi:hypothetical protein